MQALSKRELEVLQALADGAKNVRVAEELGISPHTVAAFKIRIFTKLAVHSSAHAVATGIREGLIS